MKLRKYWHIRTLIDWDINIYVDALIIFVEAKLAWWIDKLGKYFFRKGNGPDKASQTSQFKKKSK